MLRGIGSAWTARGSAEYEIAESTAAGLVRAGYTVITRTGHRQLPAGPAAPGHTTHTGHTSPDPARAGTVRRAPGLVPPRPPS